MAIITFNRPSMMRRCVESALKNETRPLEIIVSDDAMSDETRAVLADLMLPGGVTLRHIAGPSIGSQSANAIAALSAASYEAVVLMHDDDFFMDGAIDHMLDIRVRRGSKADAVYGRQAMASLDGTIDPDLTRANDTYYMKDGVEGVQASPLWCALTGQFPNNGMLIRRSLALAVGYPSEVEVGRIAVDFHFAIRYAKAAENPFILTSRYTSAYTFEGSSVLRRARFGARYDGHLGFEVLSAVKTATEEELLAKDRAMDCFAASAAMGYLQTGKVNRAWAVYWRHWRRMDKSWPVRLALGAAIIGGMALPRGRIRAWFNP